jgi:predicted MFS family arabinose efflux permease
MDAHALRAATSLDFPRARLSPRAAFYLEASLAMCFLAGSSAPTPLYPVYQAAWGFTPVMITVVFGIYAVAVLATLLTAGSLSDHVGRRPVLLVTTLMQAATMIVFASASGLGALIVARIIQGLSTGAALGAIGAGMLDIDRARGTVANSVAPMTGTATGALLSGLMVQYLPAPTELVYLLLFALFLLQALGVYWMPETSSPRPGALASLRPHFRVPPAVRKPMLLAIPALLATWALVGFYGALGPSLVRRMMGSTSLLLGGVLLFEVAGAGALTVLLLRNRPARAVLLLGTTALLAGVSLTVLALVRLSPALFFAGALITGAGFGAGFQGAIRTVVGVAAPHERAGVLSVLFVVCYLAMGVPAVLAGLLVGHGNGLLPTATEYGVAVMGLAAVALAGTVSKP